MNLARGSTNSFSLDRDKHLLLPADIALIMFEAADRFQGGPRTDAALETVRLCCIKAGLRVLAENEALLSPHIYDDIEALCRQHLERLDAVVCKSIDLKDDLHILNARLSQVLDTRRSIRTTLKIVSPSEQAPAEPPADGGNKILRGLTWLARSGVSLFGKVAGVMPSWLHMPRKS